MKAVDSSVVVAACATWHESHEAARRAVDARPRLVAHCALEAFSVLTRLPPPHRIPDDLVLAFLEDRFSDTPLILSAAAQVGLVRRLVAARITGGAVYDALVALTVAEAGGTLLTLDSRAESTYRRCGTKYKLLG